jgi:hypothetical protein
LEDQQKEQEYLAKQAKLVESSVSYKDKLLQSNYLYRLSGYNVVVPMTSDDARKNDKSIQCMYVLSILPPFVRSFNQQLPATRTYPNEKFSLNQYFYGKLDRFIVYNQQTGELFEAKREGL